MTDHPGPITPPSFFKARLALGATALVICTAALIALASYQSRLQYEEQARVTTQNLTRTLEAAIGGTLDKANLALAHLIDEYARQRAQGSVDAQAMMDLIAMESAHHAYLEDLRLADAQGNVMFDRDSRAGQRLSLADRSYFLRLRQNPQLGTLLSKPLRSRIDNKLVVVLARAIVAKDGRFDGVALAIISVANLSQALNQLEIGEKGYATLRDEDLGIIARYPEPIGIGAVTGDSTVSLQLRELVQSGRPAGSIHVVTPFDGVERIASFRRIANYPLYLVVGLAASDYLREWRVVTLANALLAALLAALTAVLAWMLHHSRQREMLTLEILRKQARSDFLTELNNRRCFLELAEAELARTVRYGGALSMLMIDIDHFKAVNDRFGHKCGDLVLKALARIFRDTLREVDIVGRIGGEEFAILLPATDGAQALDVAERLRQIIADSEVKFDGGGSTSFTVSVGIATLSERDNSVDTLLSLADRAMYQAKQTGRNKVCAS